MNTNPKKHLNVYNSKTKTEMLKLTIKHLFFKKKLLKRVNKWSNLPIQLLTEKFDLSP